MDVQAQKWPYIAVFACVYDWAHIKMSDSKHEDLWVLLKQS